MAPVAMAAASSSAIVYTSGTRAAEAFFNRSVAGSHAGKAWIDLYDAKCDAHSVYVQYQVNAGGTQRFNNGGGCGSTAGVNPPNRILHHCLPRVRRCTTGHGSLL